MFWECLTEWIGSKALSLFVSTALVLFRSFRTCELGWYSYVTIKWWSHYKNNAYYFWLGHQIAILCFCFFVKIIYSHFFVANTINAHFFVAKMINAHFFCRNNYLCTFLVTKKYAHTFLSRKRLTHFFSRKRFMHFIQKVFARWKLPSRKFRLFGPLLPSR